MSYALTVPLVLCLFLSRIVTSSSLPMLADPTDTCASTNRVMAEKQGGEAAAEEGKEKKDVRKMIGGKTRETRRRGCFGGVSEGFG